MTMRKLVLYVVLTICFAIQGFGQSIPVTQGIKAWYAADSALILNGGLVEGWSDISGNGFHCIQPVVSQQPYFSPASLNGHDGVRFKGQQLLKGPLIPGLDTSSISIFIVSSGDTMTDNYNVLFDIGSFIPGGFWFSKNNNKFTIYSQNAIYSSQSAGLNNNGFDAQIFSNFKTVYRKSEIWENGIFQDSTNSFNLTNAIPPGTISIGGDSTYPGRWSGTVYEILIYNRNLSLPEREQVHNYLHDKYAPVPSIQADTVVCGFPYVVKAKRDFLNSYQWNDNSSSDSLVVNSPGIYYVDMTDVFGRTTRDSIVIGYDTLNYSVQLNDTTICQDDTIIVSAGPGHYQYLWSNGSTSPKIKVYSAGVYSVTVTDCKGNVSSDTLTVTVRQLPVFSLGNDTSICFYNSYTLAPVVSGPGLTYQWSTGSIQNTLLIQYSDTFSLTVTDNLGCNYTDEVVVHIDSALFGLTLGADTTVCSGAPISIIQPITVPVTYLWSDNSTSPSLPVSSNGAYSVELVDIYQCRITDTINVSIQGTAAFAAFYHGVTCDEQQVAFNDSSFGGSSAVAGWVWTFGDGDTSFVQNPQHLFPGVGAYSVNLEVITSEGCKTKATEIITIDPKPVAAFNLTSSCEGSITRFFNLSTSADSIVRYSWDFGVPAINGDTSALRSPEYVFASDGLYQTTLFVLTDQGCTDTIARPITVNPKPVAGFVTSERCEGSSTWFFDDSDIEFPWSIIPGSVKYNFGDGSFGFTPTVNHIYQDTGTYNVTYSFTISNGCRDTVQQSVHVYSVPVASFTLPVVCAGQPAQFSSSSASADDVITKWQWSIDSVDVSTGSSFVHTFNDASAYQVKLIVETANGCTDSETKTVIANPAPVAAFTISDTRLNAPATVAFSNSSTGASSYLFNFDDNSPIYQGFPSSHIYVEPGDFSPSLIAITNFGCTDTAYRSILVLEKYLDVAINNLYYSVTDSFLTVTAEFVNLSSSDVTDLDFVLELQNGGVIKDKLTSVLRYQGAPVIHTFSAMRISSENNSFCVRSENPNQEADMKGDNNLVCRSLSELSYNGVVYPNPFKDAVYVDLLSLSDVTVDISILDSRGRLVTMKSPVNILKGITRHSLDLSELQNGFYALKLVFGDQVIIKKIIKE